VPKPDSMMTPDERRRAVAAILARGVNRLLDGRSTLCGPERKHAGEQPSPRDAGEMTFESPKPASD
jgi:hypothetical protein